jgi:hypothetical protein
MLTHLHTKASDRAGNFLLIGLLALLFGVPASVMGAAFYQGENLNRQFPNLAADLDRAGMKGGGVTIRNQIAHCMFGFRSYQSQKARCAQAVTNQAAGTGGPEQAHRVAVALQAISFLSI